MEANNNIISNKLHLMKFVFYNNFKSQNVLQLILNNGVDPFEKIN